MDSYEQLDMFASGVDPLAVDPPVPDPRGVQWTRLVPGKEGRCAHCTLVRDAQERQDAPRPRAEVRPAGWRRTGPLGETLSLCEGHRRLQLANDRLSKIT